MVASYETENQELHKIPAYWGAGFIPLIYNLLSVAFMSLSITYHKGWHNENECNNTLILYMQRTHNYFLSHICTECTQDQKVQSLYLVSCDKYNDVVLLINFHSVLIMV